MKITCDHRGCAASYESFDFYTKDILARDSGWLLEDDGQAFCKAHRAEHECPPLYIGGVAEEETEPPVRVECRDRIHYRIPEWVQGAAILCLAALMVLLAMQMDLRSQLHSAHFMEMLNTREHFEFSAAIKRVDCNNELPEQCSGLMITSPDNVPNKAVRYSCDQDHCWFEIK